MTKEQRVAIARMGGSAVPSDKRSYSRDPELAKRSGKIGGKLSGGNFANDPERAADAGRIGGQKSGGNFARNHALAVEAGRKGGLAKRKAESR